MDCRTVLVVSVTHCGHAVSPLPPLTIGTGTSSSAATSPAGPHTPAGTSAHTAAAPNPSSSPCLSIQQTIKTSQQVYVTHAAVAAAAAAAGGLVGGAQHLDVRTSANVAELAVDPAAVVDFDSLSPTSTTAAPSAFINDGSTAVGSSNSAGGGADSHAVPAVLPEDKQDVAATLQRLRSAGQLQGPAASVGSTGLAGQTAGQTAGQAVNTEDMFIGAGASGHSSSSTTATNPSTDLSTSTAGLHGQMPSSFSTATASAAGHPSAQGVSAGTAAPARAGYPDPVIGTAAEGSTTAADPAGLQAGMQPVSGSSSSLLAVHDAAAHAAAVAGALAHIGTPVVAAAAMAETATQPAQAVEAAAAAAAATSSYDETTSPATSTAARAGSLQQQHTLADFLLDEHVDEHFGGTVSPPQHSSSSAHAVSAEHQVDLSVGTAAAEEDVEVLLDVGRSTQLLSADGTVAQAAAVVPHEAVAAIQATSETPEEARSPRHPSLRQLSMSCQQGPSSSSSTQQDKPPGSLPYGLTVADIVAATVASEERRFRVVSPRSSGGPVSPQSCTGSNFFTASSGSAPSTPRGDAAAAGPAVERSSSPMSATATRAIFDSVQLAVQQQQQQDQLAQAVVRSGSLCATPAHMQAGDAQSTPGAELTAEASTTGQMASAGSGDSTATSSRPSSADPSVHRDSDDSLAASGDGGGVGAAVHASMDVTQQNAKVMQDMLLQEQEAAAAGDAAPAAKAPAVVGSGSGDSAASVCGDFYVDQAGALSSSKEPTEQASHPTSINSAIAGDKLAAAVAAGMADPVGAAAAGTDVAATAASAFPSVLFGADAMPVDVAATPRSLDSSDTHTGISGISADDMSPQDLSTASAMANSALAALSTAGLDSDAGLQDPPAVTADTALLRVVEATSSAGISTALAGTDAPAAAAAAAGAAATEMHAASPDPAAAAADAAMLVVDAASTVPGLLEPSDVASAAAAAGAAAAAAATPGMDPHSAAVACSFAAAAPLAPPEEVGAAAASALAGLQDSTGTAAAVADSSAGASAAALPHLPPAFAPMPTDMHAAERTVNTPAQASAGVQDSRGTSSSSPTAGLHGVLPILAPAGQVGDAISISSLAFSVGTPPSEPAVTSASFSTAQQPTMADSAVPTNSTAELLNREGLSKMYDPLIIQLALATSAPLEGLGLDESDFLAAHGSSAAAVAAAGREPTQSGSFGKAAGMLLLQPHPAASLAASTSLGGGPAEGSTIMSHLAAAEQAMSQLDTQLQRQRTDSISLGAGRSAASGELDDVPLTASGVKAAAEVPAGPGGVDAGSGS